MADPLTVTATATATAAVTATAAASKSAAFNKIAAFMVVGGGLFAYAIVFLLLFLAGWIIPLPEEATVIAAGYVTHRQGLSLPVMFACVLAGIQCGDLVIFWIGRTHGDWVFSSRLFRRILPADRLARARKLFAEHGSKMAFFGRFIAGVRLVVFFTAGNLGVPVTTFILYDFLAILLTIPMGLLAGWYFADHIDEAFHFAGRSYWYIFGALALGVVVWLIWKKVHEKVEARIEAPKG